MHLTEFFFLHFGISCHTKAIAATFFLALYQKAYPWFYCKFRLLALTPNCYIGL